MRLPKSDLVFAFSVVLMATTSGIALADDAKPFAGQTVSVLLPSPQDANMAADFEKATGIKLDMQTASWDDVSVKISTALLAGTAPADVTEFDWSWTGQFAAADWYTPLNDTVDAATLDDIKGSTIFNVNGKVLAIPYTNDFRVMLVNKKQFADAGVTVMPKTLDELVAAAKAVKAKGIVKYPIGLPLSATEGASTSWYLLTKAFGGDLFDKDMKPLFTAPDSAGYKAMAFEMMLLKEGLVDPASTGLKDSEINETLFAKGLTSIMISGEPGRLGAYNDPAQSVVAGQVQAIPVATESGKTRSFGLLEGLGIPRNAQNPEAAKEFIKWMTSKDYQIHNYGNGVLPTRTSALAELQQQGKLVSGEAIVEQAPTVEALFPSGAPAWYPQFSLAVNTSINSAAKGEISVEQAVQRIAEAAAEAVKQ
ncbi:MAG: extracellular solute-binding protein [Mesorhizobium sp.]|nr:extracellular solute-binding protein [Mesorhizobium sp. M2A.F.Ca.ET.043.02.1.1]RUW40466.1 extracellular solute-binding protein [Mesorhizobium sp. M2A.F.Ca.ET.015.02.1.1]RUW78801.1 extracellular solute-binding protein [Mesorhizobium sp. M2A.F.Ca.ET.067.02.1.1]RVC92062.1 extracellular solute-binding protein [Mesorhizobium sp. M2A.F.Ca.ET.017.03.2.1]RVC94366.1 extracellular solute-binding protein [Mesorhizobium sp. M2A.F.Ca.ET.029.05.1.1]RWB43706.1 MAG: extracellular solute-binding protein [Me